jgi:RNA-binding protein 5/10
MFYEAISDFFYDPKSKLYYGNRKGAYFRYDATPDPPAFVEVQKVTHSSTSDQNGMQNTLDQVPIQSSTMPQQGAEAVKPKIAIKWKTKKIKSSSSAPSSPTNVTETGPSISKSQKQQIANIEKWTEKQAELKQDIGASSLVTMLPPTTTVSSGGANQPSMALSNPSVDTGKVRMTAKGEPICMVCKRKFPNIDKLRLHERASELHKNNLQKFQEQEQASGAKRKSPDNTSAPPAAEYQDRAQKRRQLHGPEMTNDRRATNMLLHNPPESAAPGVALDESHIGHQMLQKMGWKGHNANDDDQNGEEGRNNQTTTEQLRKDWDRIEALAKNNRR